MGENVSIPYSHTVLSDLAGASTTKLFQRSYRRIQELYAVGMQLLAPSTEDELYKEAMISLRQFIEADRYFIAAYNAAGQLEVRQSHAIDLSSDSSQWPVSQSILKEVMEKSHSVLLEGVKKDETASGRDSMMMHSIRSVMCVPVFRNTKPHALLYADVCFQVGAFSLDDLRLMTGLAAYLRQALYLRKKYPEVYDRPQPPAVLRDEKSGDEMATFGIIGQTKTLQNAFKMLKKGARKKLPLLLTGENGTGKELFASAAHQLSPFANGPFVAVNLAGLSDTLIESELFGHRRGSFTGAEEDRKGKFELAHKGTLFLDEVGDIPMAQQVKLLRVLESRSFERVGDNETITSDFRLICATNKDLGTLVAAGTFREDLYYRILGLEIKLPPLRDRVEALPLLVEHTLKRIGSEKQMSSEALTCLMAYDWPGNIRQLVRVIEAGDAISEANIILPEDLPPPIYTATDDEAGSHANSEFLTLEDVTHLAEKAHIQRALELTRGNKDKARKMLGVAKATFWKRLKDYGFIEQT